MRARLGCEGGREFCEGPDEGRGGREGGKEGNRALGKKAKGIGHVAGRGRGGGRGRGIMSADVCFEASPFAWAAAALALVLARPPSPRGRRRVAAMHGFRRPREAPCVRGRRGRAGVPGQGPARRVLLHGSDAIGRSAAVGRRRPPVQVPLLTPATEPVAQVSLWEGGG